MTITTCGLLGMVSGLAASKARGSGRGSRSSEERGRQLARGTTEEGNTRDLGTETAT
jgi:hypothetical protein